MAVASSQKSPGVAATLLTSSPTDSTSGAAVTLVNRHATVSTYIGAAGVTTGTGFELKAGESISVDLDAGEALYGIVTSGTGTVHVLEVGV